MILTSDSCLRFKDLECFTRAEKGSDEIHVDDRRKELKWHFLDRARCISSTRILGIQVSRGTRAQLATHIEQQVKPTKALDRPLK